MAPSAQPMSEKLTLLILKIARVQTGPYPTNLLDNAVRDWRSLKINLDYVLILFTN